jgi:predicted amidohydrolase YtcJ
MSADIVIVNAEVDGARVDVEVAGGTITAIGEALPGRATERVDAGGGALIPGLHDHHIHLLAGAAARESLDLHATDVRTERELALAVQRALERRPGAQWLRIVGYHESIAGELDADLVDRLVPDRPARVQHRTGMLWVLNRQARDLLDTALSAPLDGIERDGLGHPTGRLWRLDDWLHDHLPPQQPDLAAFAAELRAVGITGVTDTTPFHRQGDVRQFVDAWQASPSGITMMLSTSPALVDFEINNGPTVGPVKLFVDDHTPPDFDSVLEAITCAHSHHRPVAMHVVTRAGLAFAVATWNEAGARRGDRVEHGAVVPPDLRAELLRLGLQVVTQPAFVATRGDDYLADVDPEDLDHLWPCRSLIEAGIPVAAGSDAPYGPIDPWVAIHTACTRRTRTGQVLGADEGVEPGIALGLYLGHPLDPGGPRRRVMVGEPADLCLLDRPLVDVLSAPSHRHVVRTWSAGSGC